MRPGTPLPWVRREKVDCNYGRYSAAMGPVILDPSEGEYAEACSEDDAAYIAHACNAYPRLVASLKECLALVESDYTGTKGDLSNGVAPRAAALLTELGEQ